VHTFDAHGRPVAVTDQLGHQTRQEWDEDGRPLRLVDPLGGALTRTWDERGRPTGLLLPTSGRSHIGYGDPAHPELPTVLRDPAGNELLLEYDDLGRPAAVRTPDRDGPLERRTYHRGHGRIATRTDGNGAVTSYEHDDHGDLTAVTPPAPLGRTEFHRDALSRVTGVRAGNGGRTGYRHDAAGRLTEVVDEESGRSLLSLVHDAFGRVVRKAGPGWAYDFRWMATPAGSRLAAAVRTAGDEREEIGAVHDAAGSLTSVTWAGGTTRYVLDAAGRPHTVVTPTGRTARLGHDAAGRLTRVDFGRGSQTIRYDAAGRRTALTVSDASGRTVLSEEYGYDSGSGADSDVLRCTVSDGEFTGYAYDGLKRLARAGGTEYAYDAAHHLVRLGNVRFTLNPAGQVTRFGETEFAYDGAGNFTEETNPTGSFAYSPTHQTLTGVFGGVQVVDVAYDGLGQETPRRITETTVEGDTVTHVLTHSPLGVLRVTDDGVPTDFVRTPDGALLAVVTADGRHYWAVTDQRGSVLALLDEEGALAARYRYTPHGAVTASGPAAAVNPFRYRGAYQLLRSAHVLDHHLYNGHWGRFTQPDPTGRQYAPYTFSDNDPLNSGTWTRHDFWSVLARPHEPAAEVFLPRPPGPGQDAAAVFTGAGATPDATPLVAGPAPSRTLHRP
jgi:RHS repeat-associated protein